MDATTLDLAKRLNKPRHALARSHMQASGQHINEAVRARANTIEFKDVTARKTRRTWTVYLIVARLSGSRAKKYFARRDTPAEAASMVINT